MNDYRVIHAGKLYQYSTEGACTHVVLARYNYAAYLAGRMTQAREQARQSHAIAQREADPDTRQYVHNATVLARHQRIAALPLAKFMYEEMARAAVVIVIRKASGDFDHWHAVAWCSGVAEANEAEAEALGRGIISDVLVCEVSQP